MDENRITGAAKELSGKAQGAVGDLTGNHETQARGAANEAQGTAENLYGQAKDAVRDVADQASGMAQDALRQGRERFPEAERAYRQGNEAVGQYTRESPLVAILMAGAVGYVLALLIHRK